MSYHIYTTSGIVLKRKTFGEADTVIYILTRDLGLIIATAKSSRSSKSKLKGALQEYSTLSISCVKGKNGWKVTNASSEKNLFFDVPVYGRKVLAQITSFLLKTIVGEMPQKNIFEIVKSGFDFIKNVKEENISSFEVLMVLRVLHELGYVAKDQEIVKYFSSEWEADLLEEVGKEKLYIVSIINKAMKESQL